MLNDFCTWPTGCMIDIRNGGVAVWFSVNLMRIQGVKLPVTAPKAQKTHVRPPKKNAKQLLLSIYGLLRMRRI